MDAIFQTTFQMDFLEWKCMNFDEKLLWSLFLGVQLAISQLGSDNGLAPTRRQAIIWTDDG